MDHLQKETLNRLEWPDYLIFGTVLALSFGIGIFYGCFGNKNKTNEEFLMASRSMSILPVVMSLICRLQKLAIDFKREIYFSAFFSRENYNIFLIF